MPAYVGDRYGGCVMIKKVGNMWNVYNLKEVQVKYASYGFHSDFHKYKSIKFIFEKTPSAKHGYQPYEKDDASSSPNVYLKDVQAMAHHKIRVMI